VLDDAGVLNKTTKKSLNYDLQTLEVGITPCPEPRIPSRYALAESHTLRMRSCRVLNKTTKKSLKYDLQTLEVRVTPCLGPRMPPGYALAACWHKVNKTALKCKLQTLEVRMHCSERRTPPEQAPPACHAGAWRGASAEGVSQAARQPRGSLRRCCAVFLERGPGARGMALANLQVFASSRLASCSAFTSSRPDVRLGRGAVADGLPAGGGDRAKAGV